MTNPLSRAGLICQHAAHLSSIRMYYAPIMMSWRAYLRFLQVCQSCLVRPLLIRSPLPPEASWDVVGVFARRRPPSKNKDKRK